jgi:hypothetical protein
MASDRRDLSEDRLVIAFFLGTGTMRSAMPIVVDSGTTDSDQAETDADKPAGD